jgi:hypothetical protein
MRGALLKQAAATIEGLMRWAHNVSRLTSARAGHFRGIGRYAWGSRVGC